MFLALQNLIYQDPPYGEDIINLQSIIFYLLFLFNLNVTSFCLIKILFQWTYTMIQILVIWFILNLLLSYKINLPTWHANNRDKKMKKKIINFKKKFIRRSLLYEERNVFFMNIIFFLSRHNFWLERGNEIKLVYSNYNLEKVQSMVLNQHWKSEIAGNKRINNGHN